MSSLALQAHLDLAGKVLDDPPAFLPWDRSYCCCDCCFQVRDSLEVVAIHPVLKAVVLKPWRAGHMWPARLSGVAAKQFSLERKLDNLII